MMALEGEPPIGTHTLPHPIWYVTLKLIYTERMWSRCRFQLRLEEIQCVIHSQWWQFSNSLRKRIAAFTMFTFMSSFIFLSGLGQNTSCFLLRSEEELMAVKETHKEPERLSQTRSVLSTVLSYFLNFTLFPCQNLISGGGLCFLIGVVFLCSWRCRAWRRCAEVSTGCPATTNQTEAKQCGSSMSLLLIWTHLNMAIEIKAKRVEIDTFNRIFSPRKRLLRSLFLFVSVV